MRFICQSCSILYGITRIKTISIVGICPTCQKAHVLYPVQQQVHVAPQPDLHEALGRALDTEEV